MLSISEKIPIKHLVLCSILLVISARTIAQNQGNTDLPTLYISEYNSIKRIPDDLSEAISERFSEIDINVEYLSTTNQIYEAHNNTSGPAITINYSEDRLYFAPFSSHIFEAEPGIEGAFDFVTEIRHSQTKPLNLEEVLEAIMGLGLYVLDDCEQAQNYLIEASTSEAISAETQPGIAFYLGNCAVGESDYQLALEFYLASLPDQRDTLYMYPNAAYNTAWTYHHLDETKQGLEFLHDYVESAYEYSTDRNRGNEADTLRTRARYKALIFDYIGAVEDLTTAIEYVPDYAPLYVERGKASILLYEWDRVLEDYNTALELDPTYADAYFYRGILYYSLLEREEALTDFETYLELAPSGEHKDEAQHNADSIRVEREALSAP